MMSIRKIGTLNHLRAIETAKIVEIDFCKQIVGSTLPRSLSLSLSYKVYINIKAEISYLIFELIQHASHWDYDNFWFQFKFHDSLQIVCYQLLWNVCLFYSWVFERKHERYVWFGLWWLGAQIKYLCKDSVR